MGGSFTQNAIAEYAKVKSRFYLSNFAVGGDGMLSQIRDLNDENLTTLLEKTEQPVLIDFWGDGCPPCQQLDPIIEELAQEFKDKIVFCKMNIIENLEMAIRYNIRSVPTLLIFGDGEIKGRIIGLHNKTTIKFIIEILSI